MNRVKKEDVEIPQKENQKSKENKGEKVALKFVNAINVFGYFDKRTVVLFMPYVFFLTGLAILYIGNSFYAEHTIREIDKTAKELKELRSEFITGKSELMYRSKLSEVAAAIAPLGLKEATVAPKKILLHSTVAKP